MNKRKIAGIIGIVVVGIIAIACSSAKSNTPSNAGTIDPLPSSGAAVVSDAVPTSEAPPPPQTLPPITGSDAQLMDLHATLNGKFKVDYQASSFCIIIDFLKADGTDGSGVMDGINTCAGDINEHANGSKLVTLRNVTMIQVDNTHGTWTVTFTPIG